jgi:hypothetical protein
LKSDHTRKRNFRKEDKIRQVWKERGEHPGLAWIFSAMEPCSTSKPWHKKQTRKTYLLPDDGQCLHYYCYFLDEELEIMSQRQMMNGLSLPLAKPLASRASTSLRLET